MGAGLSFAEAGSVGSMRELEAVWKLARADLVIPIDDGGQDLFLWEHCVRVAKGAEYLSRLPEVHRREPDHLALLAAALYHEVGWVSRWREGEIQRFEILLGVPAESMVIDSIRVMQNSLQGAISAASLSRASDTLRSRTGHDVQTIEGIVLADADNLEEFGLGFLWTSIRRGLCGGKGVRSVLDAWKRRTEYQFWTARLKDSFKLEESRKLAQQRLVQLETFLTAMEKQHEVEDIRNMVESIVGQELPAVPWPVEIEPRPRSKG